jgi:pulcherriminic acid synthase
MAPPERGGEGSGFRTYEVYQRQRVRDATPLIKPRQLTSVEYLVDPYPIVAILREHYPCYRDWAGNAFWITRYDDVTSVFVDDANFATRSKRWFCGIPDFGRDLGNELPVRWCWANNVDELGSELGARIAAGLGDASGDDREHEASGTADLATEFCGRFAAELLTAVVGIPAADQTAFLQRYWRMQRASSWDGRVHEAGMEAIRELEAYFEAMLAQRRGGSGGDLVTVMASMEVDGEPVSAADVVATLLEADHETLHGALANLWYLLLTTPTEFDKLRADRRLVRFAHQEALRHTTPVVEAKRFARHEVERFGRLLPEGALMTLSAAAANRDPRQFDDPDRFDVTRKDICQREPRGSYRADGLPAGVAFGFGRPSRAPALPENEPRSRWAWTRDVVVAASEALLDAFSELRLADGATPVVRSLRVGEMHTCWSLPVQFRRR